MNLNRHNIDIALARNKMTVSQLAKAYGVSRQRMNVILSGKNITPRCAGKVADALGCDIAEIIEEN